MSRPCMSGKQATTVWISPAYGDACNSFNLTNPVMYTRPMQKCRHFPACARARSYPARAQNVTRIASNLADGLFRFANLGLALNDQVTDRRSLKTLVLEC